MSATDSYRPAAAETQTNPTPPLERQVERDGRVTYRNIIFDTATGVTSEITYDQHKRPVRILKRTVCGASADLHLDPETGRRRRLSELSRTADGQSINREVVYLDDQRQSEVVTVFARGGVLSRIIERQHIGSRTTFQAETTYDSDGNATLTVAQHMDRDSGALKNREQTHWVTRGQRAMTEHLYFTDTGRAARYVKVLYYLTAGPFSEERQDFHPATGHLVRRELLAYSESGHQTCHDLLYYAEDGSVAERKSTFFDPIGRPIAIRAIGRDSANSLWV